MALLDSAFDGTVGALVAGSVALLASRTTRRSRRQQQQDEWESRADELVERAQRDARKQAEGEIRYLRGESARKDAQIASKDEEIRRLNRLLNRGRGADD